MLESIYIVKYTETIKLFTSDIELFPVNDHISSCYGNLD